jgi:hypothetical protein
MYAPAATHEAIRSPRKMPMVSAFARTELGTAVQIAAAAAAVPVANKPPTA